VTALYSVAFGCCEEASQRSSECMNGKYDRCRHLNEHVRHDGAVSASRHNTIDFVTIVVDF
jgi:hypothetical protein